MELDLITVIGKFAIWLQKCPAEPTYISSNAIMFCMTNDVTTIIMIHITSTWTSKLHYFSNEPYDKLQPIFAKNLKNSKKTWQRIAEVNHVIS